jgi:hypothetical protein
MPTPFASKSILSSEWLKKKKKEKRRQQMLSEAVFNQLAL